MTHGAGLIPTVVAAFGLATILGFLAAKLKLPPVVGYLLAGVLIGPHTRGFVADVALARQLADLGVMLLLFGVGLHLSLEDLLAVRKVAIPGAIIQIVIAAALGSGTALMWGWRFGSALVFGVALSVASTVVVVRALEARGALNSFSGRIAMGWLIVQDVVMVLVLVVLPAAAGGGAGNARPLVITFAKVAAFVVLMLLVGGRILPRLLWMVAKTGSRELFTLCVIAAAVVVAYGSAELFGVTFALGAFFAGTIMRESALSHRAAEESLPLRDAFAVLFFVSVGMLFDPMVVVRQPFSVIAVTAIVMIGTPILAVIIVLAFRYPLETALLVGASLAQIGEFSFIVAELGVSLRLISAEAQNLILAAALISIALNPLMFMLAGAVRRRRTSGDRNPDPLAELPVSVDSKLLTGHVVLVGYGRVGRRIASALSEKNIPYVVIEQNREFVETLRKRNVPAVSGNAVEAGVLVQGHVARARMLVVAMPDTVYVRKIVELARMLNPRIEIVLRTHSDEEAGLLRQENAGEVFMGEHELAAGMSRYILERMAAAAPATTE